MLSRRVLAQASPFSLKRENPAYFKNSDLTLSLKRGILAQARDSRSSEGFSLKRESHSLNRLPLAQATHSSLGRDSHNFQFQNTDPLAWARSSRSSENLAVIFSTKDILGITSGSCVLKRNTCILHSINPEIDRTYHRLVRENRTLDTNFVSVSEHPVAENTDFEHSVSVHSEYSDSVHSVAFPNFDHSVHSENMAQPPTPPGPRERTLRESIIDDASGGALGDMTPYEARSLIEKMASNSQQFNARSGDAIVVRGVHDVGTNATRQDKLETKIDSLTTLITQLAINQKKSTMVRVCGIFTSSDHYSDMCPSLLEPRTGDHPEALARGDSGSCCGGSALDACGEEYMFATLLERKLATLLEPKLATLLEPELATSLEPKLATLLEPELATSLEPKLATLLEPKLATLLEPKLAT
ncbi:hypothetical protein Lal_00024175 [Lupinus albus]|nr:hypothetical protein Lal_00024175 [Lupinus albus]